MKKLLALILAVLMLASLAIASVAAEEETIDMSEFFYEFGYRNIYLGDPVEAPPVLDGEITDGEYTATRTIEQGSRHLTGQHESDFVEYFAYDDEWVYLAFTMKQTTLSEWEHALEVKLEGPVYTLEQLCDAETKPFFKRNVSWSELKPDGTIELKSSDPGDSSYEGAAWDEDVFMAWGRNEET
jgi:hypothetical protein